MSNHSGIEGGAALVKATLFADHSWHSGHKEGERAMKKNLSTLIMILLFTLLAATSSFAKGTVCKIGSKGYSSLQDAINNVKNGETITVTKAIKTDQVVLMDKPDENITQFAIDFKKKKYTYTGYDYAFVLSGFKRTVTFKNINFNVRRGFLVSGMGRQNQNTLVIKKGTYVGGPSKIDYGQVGGLIIEDAKFTHKGKYDPWLVINGGTVAIRKGTFTNCKIENHAICNLAGGKFTSSNLESIGGKITITGGTYTTDGPAFGQDRGSEIIIKGGTFTSSLMGFRGKMTITGGTFNGCLYCIDGGQMTISGGKCNGSIYVGDVGQNSKIIINKMTVNTVNKVNWIHPDYPVCLFAGSGGMIEVNGGTFTATDGYGYIQRNGGIVKINVSKPASLFKVKGLELK